MHRAPTGTQTACSAGAARGHRLPPWRLRSHRQTMNRFLSGGTCLRAQAYLNSRGLPVYNQIAQKTWPVPAGIAARSPLPAHGRSDSRRPPLPPQPAHALGSTAPCALSAPAVASPDARRARESTCGADRSTRQTVHCKPERTMLAAAWARPTRSPHAGRSSATRSRATRGTARSTCALARRAARRTTGMSIVADFP